MTRKDIAEKINIICCDVFEDADLVIKEDMSAQDIEGWDSLSHLSLVASVMEEFNIKFTLDEINKIKSIGELIDAILIHLG